MASRTAVAVVLGLFSVACATGAFERAPDSALVVLASAPDGDAAHTLRGAVLDTRGDRGVPGVLVIVQCTCLPAARERMTDATGAYSFAGLPPGRYTVQWLWQSASSTRTFELAAGPVRHAFRLTPAPAFVIS